MPVHMEKARGRELKRATSARAHGNSKGTGTKEGD